MQSPVSQAVSQSSPPAAVLQQTTTVAAPPPGHDDAAARTPVGAQLDLADVIESVSARSSPVATSLQGKRSLKPAADVTEKLQPEKKRRSSNDSLDVSAVYVWSQLLRCHPRIVLIQNEFGQMYYYA